MKSSFSVLLFFLSDIISVCEFRKLMKAKGPAAAKVEEEKKKGLALFGPKPPTPKLLRAFGGNINKTIVEKMKVTTLTCLTCHIFMSH